MQKNVYEYISKKTNDPIVERRKCHWTGEDFAIFQSEVEMLDKLSPVINWKKYLLPIPDLSPKARQINRLIFRNERKFYKAKTVEWNLEISTIAPEMGLKISGFKNYFEWNNKIYSLNYSWDIKKDLINLRKNSIFPSKLISNMDNSDYCNQETDDKNCYLNAWWHFNENSLYNTYSLSWKRNLDSYWSINSENIYQSYNIFTSNKVFFSSRIENSHNVWFSQDIIWSNNILLSASISNLSYVYKNKTYSKQEWEEIFEKYQEKMKTYSWLQEIKDEYRDFLKNQKIKNLDNKKNENCIWNEISNSQNCFICNSTEDSQDVYYSNIVAYLKDSMDIESAWWSQKIYQCASCMRLNNMVWCTHVLDSMSNGYYSAFLQNWDNVFASLWLNHKKYTILNQEYSKEDYYSVVNDVISDMKKQWLRWRFLMPELSPFPYNDTVAMDYFPVTENQLEILNPDDFISDAILDLWWEEKIKIKRRTRDSEINIPEWLVQLEAEKISDSIENIDDSILQKIIICSKSKRPFRVIKPELDFYRRYKIALPHTHPDIRHIDKIKQRPSRDLTLYNCSKCNKEVLSVGENKNISCEDCYQTEIYW